MSNSGVIWITGLSASGKTTIAKRLITLLSESANPPVFLDGDQVRTVIGDLNCGHDRNGRLQNAWRICRLAHMLTGQGHLVIVATMSLFHEVHDWNRAHLNRYFEVLVKVDVETAKRRDPRGLYAKTATGKEINVPGVDLTPEFPKEPHLTLENNADLQDVTPQALRILGAFTHAGDTAG